MKIIDLFFGRRKAKQCERMLSKIRVLAKMGKKAGVTAAIGKTMDDFTAVVQDSNDPAVVDLLLRTSTDANAGLRGLSIQCLGLVYDPRALDALLTLYPQTKGDHRLRAVVALHNLVSSRDANPRAVPVLLDIAKDKSLPSDLRALIIRLLDRFKVTHNDVHDYLMRVIDDPAEPQNIRDAAGADLLRAFRRS